MNRHIFKAQQRQQIEFRNHNIEEHKDVQTEVITNYNAPPESTGDEFQEYCCIQPCTCFLTIILWALIIFGFISLFSYLFNCDDGFCSVFVSLWLWWIIAFGVCCCLYLPVSLRSKSLQYLAHKYVTVEEVYNYIQTIRSNPPHIKWFIKCYHYETRTREVSYTDSDGNRQSRTETYEEEVTTHTANTVYQFNTWRDISDDVTTLNMKEFKLTKVKYGKKLVFANNKTQHDYESKMKQFKENNNRDTHQSFSYSLAIIGYKWEMFCDTEPESKSKYFTQNYYFLFTFLLCGVCYRYCFAKSRKAGKQKYQFVKEVSI